MSGMFGSTIEQTRGNYFCYNCLQYYLLKKEIDDELWQGKAISATTPVVIFGEVDIDYKPMKRVEIDVDRVQF